METNQESHAPLCTTCGLPVVDGQPHTHATRKPGADWATLKSNAGVLLAIFGVIVIVVALRAMINMPSNIASAVASELRGTAKPADARDNLPGEVSERLTTTMEVPFTRSELYRYKARKLTGMLVDHSKAIQDYQLRISDAIAKEPAGASRTDLEKSQEKMIKWLNNQYDELSATACDLAIADK